MDVGFLGLGAMGVAMAGNLLKAGHRVRVWNRSPDAGKGLVEAGAVACSTSGEAAQGDAVITMLADDAALRAVVLDSGLLDDVPPGMIHVGCSTISLALAKELTEVHGGKNVTYVSAPVFGRPDVAAGGKLNIIAAGPAAALDTVQPLLDAMGQKTWRVGDEPYRANLVKIGGNLMLAAAIESMSEVAALGMAHGLDPAGMLDIYCNTLFACRAYQSYAPGIAQRRFEPPGFKLRLGLKDVRLALAAGDAGNVPLPFGSVLRDALIDAVAAGDGEKDWSALAEAALRRAGLPRS